MIEVNSFAELRTTAPAKNGDSAFLRRYNADSNFRGGGDFTGFIGTTTAADDGGTLAVKRSAKCSSRLKQTPNAQKKQRRRR